MCVCCGLSFESFLMTNRVVCICANGNESTEDAEDGRDEEAHKERVQAYQICINLFKLSLQWACSARGGGGGGRFFIWRK